MTPQVTEAACFKSLLKGTHIFEVIGMAHKSLSPAARKEVLEQLYLLIEWGAEHPNQYTVRQLSYFQAAKRALSREIDPFRLKNIIILHGMSRKTIAEVEKLTDVTGNFIGDRWELANLLLSLIAENNLSKIVRVQLDINKVIKAEGFKPYSKVHLTRLKSRTKLK